MARGSSEGILAFGLLLLLFYQLNSFTVKPPSPQPAPVLAAQLLVGQDGLTGDGITDSERKAENAALQEKISKLQELAAQPPPPPREAALTSSDLSNIPRKGEMWVLVYLLHPFTFLKTPY